MKKFSVDALLIVVDRQWAIRIEIHIAAAAIRFLHSMDDVCVYPCKAALVYFSLFDLHRLQKTIVLSSCFTLKRIVEYRME
jgi:hypothetical protein